MERMMPAIIPHLWYSREAEEAANSYASIFPDSRVDRVTALPRRVSEAMLKMVKFDIAELERAAAGEARV
jgi:predicted 3-demethylubiquinone-9 3-methyltransferase (glyoxalase superfamily)